MRADSAKALVVMVLLGMAVLAVDLHATAKKATLAQRLADGLAKDHPDLVRVGLHVTPPGASENIIIASNVAEKIGQKSDPEDLKAMTTGRAVVLREGQNFDVTLPLHDASGKLIGAVGLTLRPAADEKKGAATRRAEALARDLERQIPSLESLFSSAGQ